MGTETRLTDAQVETFLRAARRDVLSLPSVEARWADPAVPLDHRELDEMAFRAEWDNTLDQFEMLAEAFLAESLPSAAVEPFLELVPLFDAAAPSMERMVLHLPSVAVTRLLHAVLAKAQSPVRAQSA